MTALSAVEAMPDNTAVMGLTEFVDDESPLYAKLAGDGKEVVDYKSYFISPLYHFPIIKMTSPN